MNVAILGPGSIAEDHARAVREIAGKVRWPLELRCVMGPDRDQTEAFARKYGIPVATTELDEVLNDPQVDAVIICSPSALHAAQAERCLRGGKHVLCEIPLAMSLADTDRLIELAESCGVQLMVCHTQRYWPSSLEARRRIEQGELHPHALAGRYMFLRRDRVNWKGRERDWTDNLLWHHAGHAVDLALWLLDAEPQAVSAQVALPSEPLGVPMDLTLSLRSPRDQLLTLVMSYNAHLAQHDYLIVAEEDSLIVTPDALRAARGEVPLSGARPIVRQDAEFFEAVRGERENPLSARSVRPAMLVLQAAQDQLDARLREAGAHARHPRLP